MAERRPGSLARPAFHLPTPLGPDTVYLCGHSLGAQPRSAVNAVQNTLDAWATRGVEAWFAGAEAWAERSAQVRSLLGHIVGADAEDVAVLNNLTTQIHSLLLRFAAPRGQRRKILFEAGAFPSDRFALHSVAAILGLDPAQDLIEVAPEPGATSIDVQQLLAQIEQLGDTLNLVYWSGVAYLNGQAFDLAQLTQAAHAVGAWAVFDLAHAAGNLELNLAAAQVDAACWCHYKYLNAGPGAVGGMYLHPRHQAAGPPLAGWWGHQPQAQFGAGEQFRPKPGAISWETSTPNLLSLSAVHAAASISAEVGMARIAADNAELCARAMDALQARGERVLTPRGQHGAMLCVDLGPAASQRFADLRASGILGDLRPPGVLRVAFASLYNGTDDLDRFLNALDRV